MFRIDTDTAAASLPAPKPVGTPGFCTDGDATGGTPATQLDADFVNMLQEENCSIVAGAGIALSKTDNTQVYQAILALIGSHAPVGSVAGRTGAITLSAEDLSDVGATIQTAGYLRVGPFYLQWAIGATDPADNSEPSQTIDWNVEFPTGCLVAFISMDIASATSSTDGWYQTAGWTRTGVTAQRQRPSGGSFAVTTRPIVIGIGY
jgi:hypothetical protein